MATAEAAGTLRIGEESAALASSLRRLTRAATAVALLTSPALFVYFYHQKHWAIGWSIAATFGSVAAFRGLVDVVIRKLIPWPSLFGADDTRLREEDIVNRRRAWFWLRKYRLVAWALVIITLVFFVQELRSGNTTWWHAAGSTGHWFTHNLLLNRGFWLQIAILPLFFLVNFAILFGPLMLMGVSQIRGYEPGDADWGVRLDHVRGQAEAKEDVRKIVSIWQSGEGFEKAGGKRERGLLFHGPPGTGKTMLAKAIATSFNAPFIAIPGSGFAQTFIGMDAVIVRWLAGKAKRLARKWGGQCIVFIDEIDAVGMRRASLQGRNMTYPDIDAVLRDECFYGPFGALNPSGDLIVESRAWRDRLFEQRAAERPQPRRGWLGRIVNQAGGMGLWGGTGQLALNQLLVVMDGMDNPPFMKRTLTGRINTWLDASYIVPRRIGKLRFRLPPPKPRKEQIYFIGATNVPIQNLDPALTRPGRMGRHVWFRTPTKEDRKDIFDLYIEKVVHDPELDTPKRRDEIARITNGYSPAMIEQVCSMALVQAHHKGQAQFTWTELLEAMSTIESGTAINVKYVEHETRAVAIHEAGHAAAAHVYRPERESSRLSIRMRPGSLGHHQSFLKEERFTQWYNEYFGDLVHGLGAMAAEHVFYGQNASGVGGDLETATTEAAAMVGMAGMTPQPIDVSALKFADETPEETRKRVATRFEHVGQTLMNRTRGSADAHADPIASILRDPFKLSQAAQILGQAYVTAENFIRANRDKVEAVANELVEKGEIYGDDLLALLDKQKFVKPDIDYSKEETWPTM